MDGQGEDRLAFSMLTCCHCRSVNVLRSLFLVALFVACGRAEVDLPEPSCVEQPAICPEGQTCWMDEAQAEFSCLASGRGEAGDPCALTPGQPTCGDLLTCYAVQDNSVRVCTPVCTPDEAFRCPTGLQCVSIFSNAGEFFACEPEAWSAPL